MKNLFASFRKSLELCRHFAASSDGFMIRFENFPSNCCDYTSLIIAKYLHDKGVTQIKIVTGQLRNDAYIMHEWLEVCGHVVDLTADQFSDGHIVFWSPYSAWHSKKFKNIREVTFLPATQLNFHEDARDAFDTFFHEFCRNITKA